MIDKKFFSIFSFLILITGTFCWTGISQAGTDLNISILSGAPTDLVANPISSSRIDLSWSAVSGAVSYKVYRAGVLIASLTTTSYSDTGLSPATTYSYTVSAVNVLGIESSQSSSVSATTLSTGGGGGMPAQWYNPPEPPAEEFRVLINNGAKYTNTPLVTLNLRGGPDTERMAISNFPDFRDAGQEPYTETKEWNLCKGLTPLENSSLTGQASCPEGEYSVYVKFYAPWGRSSELVSDTIIFRKEKPIVEKIKEIPEKIEEAIKEISEKVSEIGRKIAELIKPPKVKPPEIPIEELMPKETPLAMKGRWTLLTYTLLNKPFIKFTLAPLPKEIGALAEKFPELEKTFEEVGIAKLIDIEKLKTVKLTLPGLTERVGLPTTKVEPGKLALPAGVPIVKLSLEAKQQIPTEIVFAKTGGQLIDFNIALSITEKGEPQQKITTISAKPLQLVVKPDKPVKSVKGYVVFKSKKPQPTSFQFPFNHLAPLENEISLTGLAASLFFANPVFAKPQEKPVRVEEKLVLLEFEYTDTDGDGIYTAEIQAPIVEGEYEIITVMDYEDPTLGMKEIRLITAIDPEGYIFEKEGDKETRIPGAIVSLFWLNSETKQYELWPAKEYQQENPQTTDVRGTYSFLVPEGYYYLKVETPGYLVYDGKPFQVKEGSGIHVNIELKTKYWWLKIVDWKTVLLIAVIILLLYNFYRDKIREKHLKKLTNF